MPQEDITQTTPSMVTPVQDSSKRSSRCRPSANEPCSLPGPRLKVAWPTEAGARWITEHEDDPEEESPQSNDETTEESLQSNDETAEKFAKLHDAEAGASAVMAELKTHTDKYTAEDVKQALERSQEGDQSIKAHLTKVTFTVTARQALVEDEPSENDSQNAREVIAGAREQMDISLKLSTREERAWSPESMASRHAAPERHCYS